MFSQHTGLVADALMMKADHPCIISHGKKHTFLENESESSMPQKSIHVHALFFFHMHLCGLQNKKADTPLSCETVLLNLDVIGDY